MLRKMVLKSGAFGRGRIAELIKVELPVDIVLGRIR